MSKLSMCSGVVEVVGSTDVTDGRFDAVIIVTDSQSLPPSVAVIQPALDEYLQLDRSGDVAVVACPVLPSKRLIYAPTGPISRDYDDVRRFQDAADKGVKKALACGSKSPLLVSSTPQCFPLALRVSGLGALHALYTPLEIREDVPSRASKVDRLGVFGASDDELRILQALESGRVLARDVAGSDPERMAPPRVADYVQQVFMGTCIKVNVISDAGFLEKEYPLMMAVNRASRNIPRHTARLIQLEYVGDGPIDQTLMVVGKGVTYDTGGADIKAGGAMAGMHRDKCGAAFVAGFFQTLSVLKPKGLKVVGAMSMVRNSVGSDCYVADEIITSRAGVRVRVGNTDAEGRMAMCDVLCQMKENTIDEVNPSLFTIATLTGHVVRTYGEAYTAIVSNGPARTDNVPQTLWTAGESSGDPLEISTLRREDYDFHKGQSEYEDVLQANNKPSSMNNRGHQGPAAFLNITSGLDKHGGDSDRPISYTHLDIAGSAGPFPGIPSAAPLVAFSHAYLLKRP